MRILEAATARDQAIDLADECNNHRDMLRNCLQWMDQTAIASMLEANGWIEADGETAETRTEYCDRMGHDM